MKNFFNKLKHKSRQETQAKCNNLSVMNDCQLVSEIKNCQTKLDAIELEIKDLKKSNDVIPTCESLFNNHQMRYLYEEIYWTSRPISRDIIAKALCSALKDVNLDELIEELTALYNREATLVSKENEANELREKIAEAKNALGIK
jgi:hypothetical protein